MAARLLVSVVDDDESVRGSLPDLLRELGFRAESFASAEEFLASESLDQTRVLVLDIAMPGMNGSALQQELRAQRRAIPIVFITAHADETVRQQLFKAGAVDVLFKPFTESALLDAMTAAVRANGSNGRMK